jgi:hypothetical protein
VTISRCRSICASTACSISGQRCIAAAARAMCSATLTASTISSGRW